MKKIGFLLAFLLAPVLAFGQIVSQPFVYSSGGGGGGGTAASITVGGTDVIGGADQECLFIDGTKTGADAGCKYNKTTDTLTIGALSVGSLSGVLKASAGVITGSAGISNLAASTSADLASVLSDETGSGGLAVFSSSPTIVTPTIASFANATHDHSNAAGGGNIPQASVTGLTAALAGKSASFTDSAGLAVLLSDETGSAGGFARATSPTFVTPILGTPTSVMLTNATGLPEGGLSTTDITTNDVSTSKHGFAPKAPNDATKFLNGANPPAYAVPPGTFSISFPQTIGGTVTQGAIPWFNSTTQMSTSALLAANKLVVGGGAGAAPSTTSEITYDATSAGGTIAIVDTLAAAGGDGLSLSMTSAGSTAAVGQYGASVVLGPGYTGDGYTLGAGFFDQTGNTGTLYDWNIDTNQPRSSIGVFASSNFGASTTAGTKTGVFGSGTGSTTTNIGVAGRASGAAAGSNYGVVGIAENSAEGTDPKNVGGFFAVGSNAATPLLTAKNFDAALVASNGSLAADMFRAYDNGALVFEVLDLAGTPVNGLSVQGGLTGVGPTIAAIGETNVDLNVASKGSTSKIVVNGGSGAIGRGVFIQAAAGDVASLGKDGSNIPFLSVASTAVLGFSSSNSESAAADAFWMRTGAASIQRGADSATPIAQSEGVANARGGTDTNAAGSNWTFLGSQSTGTGLGGSIIFSLANQGSTGTTANTRGAVLTLAPPATGTASIVNGMTLTGGLSGTAATISQAGGAGYLNFDTPITIGSGGVIRASIHDGGTGAFVTSNIGTYGFAAGGLSHSTAADTVITRGGAAASLQQGVDSATPIAQTFGVANARGGTDTNTAGSAWNFNGSQSTGTGVGGSIIFNLANQGSTGTTANTRGAVLTLAPSANGTTAIVNGVSVIGGISGVGPTITSTGNTTRLRLSGNSTAGVDIGIGGSGGATAATFSGNEIRVRSTIQFGFSSNSDPTAASVDTFLTRESAAVFQMGADAASPVAYTLKGSDATGTDTAGANTTFAAGGGTGTGAGGSINFNVANTGSTGSSINTFGTALQVAAPNSGTTAVVNGVTVTGATVGNSPSVAAVGSDSNISLNLTSKGTGNVVTSATLQTGADLIIANLGQLRWNGGSTMIGPSAGTVQLGSNAATSTAYTLKGNDATGSTNAGGAVTVAAGNGTSGVANGGNTTIRGGAKNSTGKDGATIVGRAQTVATLPACAAGTQGAREWVTDALTPAALAVVVGGGAVVEPVFCDGTNWIVG